MNIYRKVVVSYKTLEERDKLQDYLLKATNKKYDFGPLDYANGLTLVTFTQSLEYGGKTNITCALYIPTKFHKVDDFISWHKRFWG